MMPCVFSFFFFIILLFFFFFFFFFNDTATTEIYTLSLHDALPIFELYGRVPRTKMVPQMLAELDRLYELGEHLRSEEHTSELQSPCNLVCRLLLEKKKKKKETLHNHIINYTTDVITTRYSPARLLC